MNLNLSPGAVFHAELVSGSKIGPKPTQNPMLTKFRKLIFLNIGFIFTFDRYFEAWEHQNRTRHEKILLGSYSEIFWPDGKLIGAGRRSKMGPWGAPCNSKTSPTGYPRVAWTFTLYLIPYLLPNLDLRWAPMSLPSGQKISE